MTITYGNLGLAGNPPHWRITDLQPHVAIAFKRLFTKAPKTAQEIVLTDTDENRADLHWFMQRYPLKHVHEADLTAGVERIRTKSAERERILMPDWTPATASGFVEGRQPYGYQQQAAALTIQNPNLLLGDDLGLGKTISALCTLTSGAPLVRAWLQDKGYDLFSLHFPGTHPLRDVTRTLDAYNPHVPVIVSGRSQRGPWNHAVVYFEGQFFDPAGADLPEPLDAPTVQEGVWWIEVVTKRSVLT